jgi:hypothetical protein
MIHPWEIWKTKPPGMQQEHWFVIPLIEVFRLVPG